MEKVIPCREMGIDCLFEAQGLTEYDVLMNIMRHVQDVHTRDWFELEEIHAAAQTFLRNGAG